ncbi:putative YigZ family protein [Dyadobacter jejuensis]|uniref:Putative YigZ family protein n=1 Tax=Dyadobacter jejuensis TaxID=1082580 RepID=A0A316APJ2_9BACT|nr:YigZ family protein [Dyadobacter jejuensis]PWJ59502.1 putative YigZ family protein [Dyadobacter jejuensis]
MLFEDSYQTIAEPVEGFFKDKGSKFYAYAYPIGTEAEAKDLLAALKELHPKAVHHCYAYRLGQDRMSYRMSDDGEPSGTAGRPILNTLYSKDITNLLVVVVRYFGGTLLGVPGLINAYKTATEEALAEAEFVTQYMVNHYRLTFAYVQMNDAMRIVKEMNLPVLSQDFQMECTMTLEVRTTLTERFIARCDLVEGLVVTLES